MKRYLGMFVILVVFLTVTIVHSQDGALNRVQQADEQRSVEPARMAILEAFQVQQFQQRGGGGRGGAVWLNGVPGTLLGAWWTNNAIVERLGLTDDQKTKIERAFENHRPKLESSREFLEKEEAQLARLLEAESVDRNAILAQIDRVVQARSEMERVNSAMTLEMREQLTRAQWMQLPVSGRIYSPGFVVAPIAPGGAGGRGQRTGRGQQQQ